MAVRKLKPTTPGQRHKIIGTFEEITASVPEKSLVYGKKSSGGRNSEGKMTMRYIGGGHRKVIRIVEMCIRDSGKIDKLEGMKENVICGHLIPAGTGQREFEKLIVGSKEEYDRILANKKTVLDYNEVE